MLESGFENNNKVKQHTLIVDDQLDSKDIQFLIFILGKKLETITLSKTNPSVTWRERPLGVFDEKLWFDGQPLSQGKATVDGQDIYIVNADQADTKGFVFNQKEYFSISGSKEAAIVSPGSGELVIHDHSVIFNRMFSFTYFNEDKVVKPRDIKEIKVGDRILTNNFLLERRSSQWRITDFHQKLTFTEGRSLLQPVKKDYSESFPRYHRSPRIYQEPLDQKIKIEKKPSGPKEQKNTLLKMVIPPLGMFLATGFMSVFSGRNPLMMMGMGLVSVLTTVFTVTQYFSDKTERSNESRKKQDDYDTYLTNTVSDIASQYASENHILHYKNPAPATLIKMMGLLDSRIYERMANNKDFLEITLGVGDQPGHLAIDSDINPKDFDENAEQIKDIINRFKTQRKVPVTLNLSGQTLGMVGTYSVLRVAIINLLIQIVFFHSYRDVQLLTVVPEKNYQQDWRFLRMLPHFNLSEIGFRGFIHDNKSRDVILNQFYQILTKRRQVLEESGREKPRFSPQYVLMIVDDTLLAGHPINEFLAEDISELGVSVIWAKEDQKFLSDTVTALVEYQNQGAGEIINDHNLYVDQSFVPYHEPEDIESNLRKLANLVHVEVEKNRIPDSLSLLDQYEVKSVADLRISDRWQAADPSKSIRSLIGWRGQSEYLYWDLHERVHGPHALVGGTTGSGKSEFLTTYLLGLAINFSPEDIGMLIVDWKGGGIANTLAPLPHFMGSITNLDGAGTARALASIKAELDKRMVEFAKYGVNNINAYMHLYKQRLTPKEGTNYPEKPIPHLILVSDEFAELKANVPEFLDELTSVARIGRSLGVHLILATQKPSGVVNDQIEANSTSKIALKMAGEQDSNELLKTTDAAHITQPGRGYLKVGQNEVYELFQSGYAGTPYNPEMDDIEVVDERIYQVTDLGQSELAYDPGEEVIQRNDVSDLPTQLEAVIEEVNRTAKNQTVHLPDRPWLPNLSSAIATPKVQPMATTRNLKVPIGLLDIPRQQRQQAYEFSLQDDSHTVIFASPGYGKSTALQTIILNLARQNTPEQVQFNLLDFGTNGLLPIRNLPHVIDISSLDEKDKLRKMVDRILLAVDQRKKILKSYSVTSLDQYQEKTGKKLPVIVNVLDSYDGLSQQDARKEEIDNILIQILREGAALGIYLIMSASRVGAIRMNMMANIQTKMVLYLNDESEVMALMGRERLMQVATPGRGQIIREEPTAIQIYLPVQQEVSDNYLVLLEESVDELDRRWQGQRPDRIPMVPEELGSQEFEQLPMVKQWLFEGSLPLAMSYETTGIHGFTPQKQPYFLFAPVDDDQNMVFQSQLLTQLQKANTDALIIDFNDSFEEVLRCQQLTKNIHVISDRNDAKEVINGLVAYMKLVKAHEQGQSTILILSDLQDFVQKTGITKDNFVSALKTTFKAGLDIIIFSPHSYIGKSFDEVPKAIRQLKFNGLIGSRVYDSPLIKSNGLSKESELNSWEAYYVMKGGTAYDKVKLPQDLIGEI